MLDFGFSEILLTSAIALVVLGPERLPKVARQVGNWMGRARAMARQLSEQLEREVSAEEFLKEQSRPKAPLANRMAPLPNVSLDPYTPLPAPTQYVAPDTHAAPPTDHAVAPALHEASRDGHAAIPNSPANSPANAPVILDSPTSIRDSHSAAAETSKPPNE